MAATVAAIAITTETKIEMTSETRIENRSVPASATAAATRRHVYPPARLRALQAQIQQDTSAEGARLKQKLHWEALKSVEFELHPHLRGADGRRQLQDPLVGELLAKRLVVQFRKSFRRDDKKVCLAATTFIAHLVNFQVVHENLALQMLQLLLHKPTDDSVEIAVGFMKEIGEFLTDMKPMAARVVFDKFRDVLHEGEIDKRVQYAVEVLFQIRKDNFKDNPAIREELDLLEEDDMITHYVELDGDLDTEDSLNIFKFDVDFEKSEEAYVQLKREILGQASDDEDDDEDDDESSEDEEEEEQRAIEIKDQSNADLVNLRRTIYLTIQSAISPEEAVHKLMKIVLPRGRNPSSLHGCGVLQPVDHVPKVLWPHWGKVRQAQQALERALRGAVQDHLRHHPPLRDQPTTECGAVFGHMFASNAIGWHCMSAIVMTEDATTSSSRIFVKILFQEISEELGMPKLAAQMKDPLLQPSLEGLFPTTSLATSGSPSTTLPVSAWVCSLRRCDTSEPQQEEEDSFRSDSRGRSLSRDRRSSRSLSYSRSPSPRRGRRDSRDSQSRSPSPKRSRRYSDARTDDSRSRSRTPPTGAAQKRHAASVEVPEPGEYQEAEEV
ncbi:unnamed protein product [Parascedosporium putredinis]|uniref:MIF4G domain-containing protein n=1 Tax=Parascedosporium putredinis TaxID=1442378 RepID=A0A9P1GWX4_9PEZI|nr:unnamed protein product [Parascedosporium putredinis]CAI7989206.1 unnamed protein product [Parascedosporium putredinis]